MVSVKEKRKCSELIIMHQSLSKKNNHICPAENVGFVYSFSLFMNIDYKFQVCKRKTKTN